MNTVSPERIENTRKNAEKLQSLILRRLAYITQESAADCMGVSSSTVSRYKEELDKFCLFLSALGLQVSHSTSMVVDRDELRFMKRVVAKYLIAELEEDGIEIPTNNSRD